MKHLTEYFVDESAQDHAVGNMTAAWAVSSKGLSIYQLYSETLNDKFNTNAIYAWEYDNKIDKINDTMVSTGIMDADNFIMLNPGKSYFDFKRECKLPLGQDTGNTLVIKYSDKSKLPAMFDALNRYYITNSSKMTKNIIGIINDIRKDF